MLLLWVIWVPAQKTRKPVVESQPIAFQQPTMTTNERTMAERASDKSKRHLHQLLAR